MHPDWIAVYNQKSRDVFAPQPWMESLVEPARGFLYYSFDQESRILWVWGVCGDGRYWETHWNRMAQEKGARAIRCTTRRNPRPYQRRFGFKRIGYNQEKQYYILEKEVG